MANNRRPSSRPNSAPTRYPKGSNAGGRTPTPERTRGQQARLWLLSLCGAVPGAIVVYLTKSYWVGAAAFLVVVMVLGFLLYLFEKRKQR